MNIDRNQIIEIMDAESSINSNERKSVADRSSYVSSYQEQYNEENNRIKNEERNTENKTQQLPQPFQNVNELVKDEYLKNNDQREQYSIKVKQEMNDKSDGKKPKSTIILYCEMTQNTQPTNNGEEEKNLQSIRIRFQFKSENIVAGATYSEQMKQVLYDVMTTTKEFDPKSRLRPWDEKNIIDCDLVGQEIPLIGGNMIDKYINTPNKPKKWIHSKKYYHQGLHIRTQYTVYEFTEYWNNMRYRNKEKHPILNYATMRPAEMQKSSKAFPVGHFIGSTERGDYQTLNKVLPQIIECQSEVSYQTVYQRGISNKV